MDEQRRYDGEPDPGRYPGPSSYDAGLYQRPAAAAGAFPFGAVPELPEDTPAMPSRSALDAIRVPLRPTEHPGARPGGATGSAPATAGGPPPVPPAREPTGYGPPTRRDASAFGPTGGPAPDGPGLERHPGSRSAGEWRPGDWRSDDRQVGDRQVGDRQVGDRVTSRRGGDTVYRTRRPVSAVVFTVVTAVLLVPVVRLLVSAGFAAEPGAPGIVPAVLMTLGLPLTGVGLYGVAGAGGVVDRQVFLRAPAGYLPVGLVLLVAAALAVA